MSSESEIVEEKTKADAGASYSPFVLLVELEGAAVAARRAEYDALKSLLAGSNGKLTPHHFVRHALNQPPAQYLPGLLDAIGVAKKSVDQLAEEVRNGVALYLSSSEAALRPQIEELIMAASAKKMRIGFVTTHRESIAQNLMVKWGLPENAAQVFAFENYEKQFPRADILLKMAKSLSCTPRQCVVVAGSQFSAKAALSAGMRCMVVPDEFTAFQDFSGADVILDDEADIQPADALNRVTPMKAIG